MGRYLRLLLGNGAFLCASSLAAAPFASPRVPAKLVPEQLLTAHNIARYEAGVEPLIWDNVLGAQAARYALQMAISDRFEHSRADDRAGIGENLWMGSRGAFTIASMFDNWKSEKGYFRAGVFPVVSRTGDWRDVGHYTQIVWPSTRKVGCALSSNARADYLVCRYWPSGNVHGISMRPTQTRAASVNAAPRGQVRKARRFAAFTDGRR